MFPRFGSSRLQFRDELNVFVAATRLIPNDRVISWQLASDTNGRHNGVRRFERGNDSFQFGAKLESFERFGIARSDVFGSSVIVQKRVLWPDRRIIEPG